MAWAQGWLEALLEGRLGAWAWLGFFLPWRGFRHDWGERTLARVSVPPPPVPPGGRTVVEVGSNVWLIPSDFLYFLGASKVILRFRNDSERAAPSGPSASAGHPPHLGAGSPLSRPRLPAVLGGLQGWGFEGWLGLKAGLRPGLGHRTLARCCWVGFRAGWSFKGWLRLKAGLGSRLAWGLGLGRLSWAWLGFHHDWGRRMLAHGSARWPPPSIPSPIILYVSVYLRIGWWVELGWNRGLMPGAS